MKRIITARDFAPKLATLTITATIGSTLILGAPVSALTAAQTAAQQTRMQTIISKGDQEISRRLTSLTTLTNTINAATKLTASDKASLTSEVGSTISGLTALKSKLDAESTLAGARTDAQQIFDDYRVYALVLPKVHLVKVADDIQASDMKLTAIAQKLQSRITADQQTGKDVSALQAKLTDLTNQVSAAQSIANKIETGVINLQPTDYNSNHQVLSGDNAQLKTARQDNQAAFTDAKSIVASLKSLS